MNSFFVVIVFYLLFRGDENFRDVLADIKLGHPVQILLFHGPDASNGLLALSHDHFSFYRLLNGLIFFLKGSDCESSFTVSEWIPAEKKTEAGSGNKMGGSATSLRMTRVGAK